MLISLLISSLGNDK